MAFEFQQAQELIEFVARRQLSGMEAVLMLEDPRRVEIVALESFGSVESVPQKG